MGLVGGTLYARMVQSRTAMVKTGLWASLGGEGGGSGCRRKQFDVRLEKLRRNNPNSPYFRNLGSRKYRGETLKFYGLILCRPSRDAAFVGLGLQ